MDKEQLEIVEDTPMNDANIRGYFPDAKILTYNELNDIDHIDDLLPHNKSYAFLLIEQQPKKGHWVSLDRLGNTINFFDSYGGKPDQQLKYTPEEYKEMLGEGDKRLTTLLKESGYNVKYNPHKYQEKSADIKTCGRHVCNRVKKAMEGKSLQQYKDFMDTIKKSRDMNYDEIVSYFFPD
jgi:hypothetical protein